MDLKTQTEQLKVYLENLKGVYENTHPPENKSDKTYFIKVKENTLPIYELLETWEEQALQEVRARKVNVHPQQVASTKENMELLLMHSYYMDVRRKRYMEMNHSIHYIFDMIIRELHQIQEEEENDDENKINE